MSREQDDLTVVALRLLRRQEKARKRASRWQVDNPEKARERVRLWRVNNPEKARAIARRSRVNNPEKARERERRWRANNPEKRRARNRGRRALKAKTSGDFTAEQFKALCTHFNQRCLRCGKQGKLTLDHVIPLAWSEMPEYKDVALNDIDNLQPLCGPCNSSKCATMVDYRTQPHQHCIRS